MGVIASTATEVAGGGAAGCRVTTSRITTSRRAGHVSPTCPPRAFHVRAPSHRDAFGHVTFCRARAILQDTQAQQNPPAPPTKPNRAIWVAGLRADRISRNRRGTTDARQQQQPRDGATSSDHVPGSTSGLVASDIREIVAALPSAGDKTPGATTESCGDCSPPRGYRQHVERWRSG
ncbi:unnamed protein product [Lampetra fluviatilis]